MLKVFLIDEEERTFYDCCARLKHLSSKKIAIKKYRTIKNVRVSVHGSRIRRMQKLEEVNATARKRSQLSTNIQE